MRPRDRNAERSRLVWESFHDEGREFLRTVLPDSPNPGVPFTVAKSLVRRYDVERVVSIGETNVLFLALDTRTRRRVVIKAMRSDLYPAGPAIADGRAALAGAVRHARQLLQTERRLLVRLRNSGCLAVPAPVDYVYDRNPALAIVAESLGGPTVLDPFLSATEPYLVLPFLTGETLEVVLAREFPSGMEERHALRALLPVVRAIEVLHRPWKLQSGRTWHCVYQDLKPANLMVDPRGPLMLIDFGGCQVVVDGVPVLDGSFTAGYAPPECEEGPARVLLACADVFTIGSTLHQMLTGIDPRERMARSRVKPGEPIDRGPLPARVSPGVRRLLTRCLAPRPSGRVADAGRVAAEIEELLAH